MTILLVAAAVIMLLGLTAGVAMLAIRLLKYPPTAPERPQDSLLPRVTALETAVRGLPSLWEEERARAERAAARIERANQRAAEKSESDDGGEEQQHPIQRALRIANGGRSSPSELRPVSEELGPTHAPPPMKPGELGW